MTYSRKGNPDNDLDSGATYGVAGFVYTFDAVLRGAVPFGENCTARLRRFRLN